LQHSKRRQLPGLASAVAEAMAVPNQAALAATQENA
jgi:hypothetical protein